MRNLLVVSLLSVLLITLGSVSVRAVHAAQGSAATASSQTVLIAVDATAQSNCKRTLHINIGWHGTPPSGAAPLVPTTMTISCPVGTVIKTAAVSLAQALAQHDSYAPMPANPKAPTAAERAALHALIDAKRLSLASGKSTKIQPLTACGATSSAYLQWTADSQSFYSYIHWYKEPNCTQVYLDYAESDPGYIFSWQQWEWDHDAYYSDWWSVFPWVPMQGNTTYSYYPNRVEPTQHWYRQVLWEYVNNAYVPNTYDTLIALCD